MDGVKNNFLSGECETVDETVQSCFDQSQNAGTSIPLARMPVSIKKVQPDVVCDTPRHQATSDPESQGIFHFSAAFTLTADDGRMTVKVKVPSGSRFCRFQDYWVNRKNWIALVTGSTI